VLVCRLHSIADVAAPDSDAALDSRVPEQEYYLTLAFQLQTPIESTM
jgi:hypothetical protein